MKLAWIALPGVLVAAGVGALAWSAQESEPSRMDTYRQLELFADVLARVQTEYVTEIDTPKAMEAAINGMLGYLDPHSSYLNATEFRDMRVQTSGEYGGLGIEVTTEDGVVKVVSPIDETPASRAGIQSGDYITHLDDEAIVGITLNDAVKRMRGAVGTKIKITIAREGQEPFDVELAREIISVKAVTSRMDGDVGIIRISTFNNENTGAQLEEAIKRVRQDAPGGLRGLVLDLRNNPGGLLDQANRVSDAFLDGGEITSIRGRNPNDVQRYNAKKGDLLPGVPIVVLINGGSASASEIVAGALKDRGRGVVLGTDSFGKGSVQTVIALNGGRDGALRLTTARYYTPSGISIQGAGIEPDLEVSQARVDPARWRRLGLSEADLPRSLENPDGTRRRGPHMIEDQPPENWDKAQDYQMKRALEVLRQGVVAERLKAKNEG
jgi:carboxyl-terminal processing protease